MAIVDAIVVNYRIAKSIYSLERSILSIGLIVCELR